MSIHLAALLALLCASLGWAGDAEVRWKDASPSVTEGSGPLATELMVTPKSSTPITVVWATRDESATSGVDFVGATTTTVIPAGENKVAVSVQIINDAFNRGSRAFGLQIVSVTGAVYGDQSYVHATITDDDTSGPSYTPPSVSWTPASTTVPSGAGATPFTMSLAYAWTTGISVQWQTNAENAVPGTDFTAASGTLTFAPGETAKDAMVTILPNATAGRRFAVQITSVTGGNWGQPNYQAIVITGAQPQVATPAITPLTGTYQADVTAAAATATAAAVLRYRLDGQAPNASDPVLPAAGLAIGSPATLAVRGFATGMQASATATAAYAFAVAPVSVDLAAGTYASPQTATLACASPGVAIRYTLDGTTPSASSALASGPIAIDRSCTLKAVGMRAGWTSSAVISADYVLAVAALSADVPAGAYAAVQSVTVSSASPGVDLRYTLDGTTPTASSALASGPITIDRSCTLQVVGMRAGWTSSAPLSLAYSLAVAPVTADLAAGSYVGARSVTLSSASAGAEIRYTLDGTTPTASSLLASGPVDLPGSCTLKAVGMRAGWTSSAVFSAAYIMTLPTPAITPAAGTYSAALVATATISDAQAVLRYTTDGTTPSAASPVWPVDGVAIDRTTTVRLVAFRSGWRNSATVSATYRLVVPKPVITPAAGTYYAGFTATATDSDAQAVLRYTTDGANPTTASPVLPVEGLPIAQSTALRVAAFRDGWTASAVAVATYRLVVPRPVITPVSGTYYAGFTATAVDSDALAELRYTTDGTNPTATSALLPADGLPIGQSTALRVAAFRSGWTTSPVAAASYTLRATRPTATPVAGTYIGEQLVTLATTTPGAVIRYTTDGSTPTNASPVASGPIAITQTTTLKALASVDGWSDSSVLSATYTIRVAPVTASIPAGLYLGHRSVTLSTVTAGADIHYTIDGTTPTLASPIATGAIELPGTVSLRAIAMKAGWRNSATFAGTYTLQVEPITASLSAGTYDGAQSVTLASPTAGAEIRYTINGSTPTASSPVASGPIQLSGNSTLRAIAMIAGWRNSATLTAAYVLRVPAPALSPAAGTYAAWPLVTATSADPLATLRYTTGSGTPGSGSTVFPAVGLQLAAPTTIKLVATRSGWTNSVVVSAAYDLSLPPVAAAVAVATDEDVAVAIQPVASDPDNTVLAWSITSAPAHGTLDGFDAVTGAVTYTPAADWNGPDAFVLAVSDQTSTVAVPVAITVRAVNDAPVPLALSLSGDEDGALAGQAQATDVDGDALAWSLAADGQHGQATVTSAGAVTYIPASDWNGSDSITLAVSDGQVQSTLVVPVTVAAVDDAPVLAGVDGALVWYRDGDAAVALAAGLTAADVDSAALVGATARIAANLQPGDRLSFTPQAGITGAWDAAAGTLSLSGAAAPAAYQAALRSLRFSSDEAFPGTAMRSVSISVNDGASDSAATVRSVGVVTRSAAPWSEGFEAYAAGADLHQQELLGATRWHGWDANPGATALVSDAQARSGTHAVAIAGSSDLVHEFKGVNSGGWRYIAWQYLPAGFSGTTYFILLNTYHDNDGNRNWSTQVAFTFNGSDQLVRSDFDGGTAPLVTGRWVELRVDIDFAANQQRFFYNGTQVNQKSWNSGVVGTGSLNLAAVDLYANGTGPVYYDDLSLTRIAPSISGGGNATYVENSAPVAVMPAVTIDAFGVDRLTGAVVQLAGDVAFDSLSVTASGNISQAWNPATGTLTLSGTSTPAAYQALLRTVAFANASDAPTTAQRTVSISVIAPTGTSNTVSATVTVTPINDAPVAQALSLSGDEDTAITGVAMASDVDGGALSWSVSSQPVHGMATVDAGSGQVVYQPNPDFNGSDAVGLTVSDGHGGSAALTVPVTVAAIDDAAVIIVPAAGSAPLASDLLLTGFMVADVDSPQVSVTITVDAGTLSLTRLSTSGATASNGGLGVASVTLDGDPAAITAALAEVVWRAPETAGAATLTVAGNGGAASVALQVIDPAGPIVIAQLAATPWSSPAHGSEILPAPSSFWNLDVAAAGRYHLWVNGSSSAPLAIKVDGASAGSLALLASAAWSCRDAAGQVQTLNLTAGTHRLDLGGAAAVIGQLILVAETQSAVQDRPSYLAHNGAITVIEAEEYDVSTGRDGWSWLPRSTTAASGIALVSQPDIMGYREAPTVWDHRIGYKVDFLSSGVWKVWVRAGGMPTSDSVHVGIDGVVSPTAAGVTWFPVSGFAWSATSMDASMTLGVATITVPEGQHELSLWFREDGVSVDQIMIAPDQLWTPPQVAMPASRRGAPFEGLASGLVLDASAQHSRSVGSRGQTWSAIVQAGAVSGAAAQVLADAGGYYGSTVGEIRNAPALSWFVDVPAAGTYDVWVRGTGPNFQGDSLHVGIDGQPSATADNITYFQISSDLSAWSWSRGTSDGPTATLVLPAGYHTVSLWMREDGIAVDRIILKPAGSPAPTGVGPAASTEEPPAPVPGNG